MAWSIAEVARMSGTTSRTLRHYDETGLLPPAWTGANGYRYYTEPELLRLQQILVLRELDLGLAEIARILEGQTDEVAALRAHHRRLLAERDRLTQVAQTVARTVRTLQRQREEGDEMSLSSPENLFEGFDPDRHSAQARERWPEQWEQSRRATEGIAPADRRRMEEEASAQLRRMGELFAAGAAPGSAEAQAEVDGQYRALCRMWTPDAAAYRKLAQTMVDDPQWRAVHEGVAEGLAAFQRDAMVAYANDRLS